MMERALSFFLALALSAGACAAARAQAADPAGSTARLVVPFEGTLDLKAAALSLTFGQAPGGVLVLDVTHPARERYDLRADIRHLSTPVWDLAMVLNGRFELVGKDPLKRELVGEVGTSYTLLNYKPVRDLYLKFMVRERKLTIDPFWFGALSGRGQMQLTGPRDMEASIELLSVDLQDLWDMLDERGIKVPPVNGIVSGEIQLKGPAARPYMNGHLAAYNGRLKSLGYDSIDLRFEGAYPLLRIEEGRIASSNGPGFKVSGAVDMADMSRLAAQLRQLKREFIVSDSDSGRAWAIRRLNTSGNATTQIKSFTRGNTDGRGEGDSVIGLEKKIGF